jgi:hypothetical protein
MAMTPIHKNGGPKASNPKLANPTPKGMTPKPAGKPQGGKSIQANSNLKGGSGSY